MAAFGFSTRLLRPTSGSQAHRVTYIELFFDLVFVFAVTQVSHILLRQPTASGLAHSLLLIAVVWWVWVFTTWAVNWLDPDRGWVRGMLVVLMLLGMLMASAIPQAFTSRALLFALPMVAMQLGRSVFTMLAFARQRRDHAVNFLRISLWHVFPGIFWVWGALAGEAQRPWIWLIALVIDYAGPRLLFWVPGLGGSPVSTWDVSGRHMAERVSLFIIIVLGESIIVTGASFSSGSLDAPHTLAFLAAFAGTVLFWLLYFNHGERGGSEYISRADERGMIAQTAYTYIPALMVLGVVLLAVTDGLVLADATVASSPWLSGLACGSTIVYLLGNAFFLRSVGGPWLLGHLAGVGVLVALFLVAYSVAVPALALTWLVNLVLLAVVVAEEVAWRRGLGRGEVPGHAPEADDEGE